MCIDLRSVADRPVVDFRQRWGYEARCCSAHAVVRWDSFLTSGPCAQETCDDSCLEDIPKLPLSLLNPYTLLAK